MATAGSQELSGSSTVISRDRGLGENMRRIGLREVSQVVVRDISSVLGRVEHSTHG